MVLPIQTIKKAIKQGYVISLWRIGRNYTCEMSKPKDPGSSVNTERSVRKAILKTWKDCND